MSVMTRGGHLTYLHSPDPQTAAGSQVRQAEPQTLLEELLEMDRFGLA